MQECSHTSSQFVESLPNCPLFLLLVAPLAAWVGVSSGRGVLLRCREMRTQSSASGCAQLKSPRTSTHPLQPPNPESVLLRTHGVPKVTRGPGPSRAQTDGPPRPTAQLRPLPLTVGRDARGEPERETTPARGAEDHLQDPARRRASSSHRAARCSPDFRLTAAPASRPQTRSRRWLADGNEAHADWL